MNSGDATVVLDPEATQEFQRLAMFFVEHPTDLRVGQAVGWFHWLRHQALPDGQDQLDMRGAIRALTPCFLAGIEPLPEPLLPALTDAADTVATDLLEQALSSTDTGLLTAAVDVWKRMVQATPNGHADQVRCLYNLSAALRTRFVHTGDVTDLNETVTYIRQAVQVIPEGHPDRTGFLSNLGLALRNRFERTGDTADLNEAVTVTRQAVQTTPKHHPNRAIYLSNLSAVLQTRFECTGDVTDLNEAVTYIRQAVQTTPEGHPDRTGRLSGLGAALQTRFVRTGDVTDLNEAVTVTRQAVQTTPEDHPDQAGRLSDLGLALRTRFECTGDVTDLNEAVTYIRQAVQTTPEGHPDQVRFLSNLGAALQTRFVRTGDVTDQNEAVTVTRQAVQTTPEHHPDRAMHLFNLGAALQTRFPRTGDTADLNEAITVTRQALQTTPEGHPDQAGRLADLSAALQTRLVRTGDTADLNEAITYIRQALQTTPEGHPDQVRFLSNFGLALRTRFEYTGDMTDLNEAITYIRQAVQTTPEGHPGQAGRLAGLGSALQTRFVRTGDVTDLNEAITVTRQAVQTTPEGHPDQAGFLSDLGLVLRSRFVRTGDVTDLNEAITVTRQAVQTTPEDHPNQAMYLSNLGLALQNRFERTGDVTDLNEAITVTRQAVQTTPEDHPNQAMYLSNLGLALQNRFERTGDTADVNEAVTVNRQAVQTTPEGHPNQVGRLSGLGAALQTRFERTGDVTDLNEAITVNRQAVQTTPEGHPDQAGRLSNLGLALQNRFERTGDVTDLNEAITAFGDMWRVRSAPPKWRIRAGRTLAGLVADADPVRAAEVWQGVVELLPQVVPRQLGRGDQQYELGRFSGLAGEAVAAVLSHPSLDVRERAERALAVVETGRGVLLSQALDARSELTDLKHHAPNLAARYVQLRDRLDQPTPAAHSAAERNIPPLATGASGESGVNQARARETHLVQDRHRLVGEFDTVLEQIRAVKGFATFGLPPSAQELLKEAGEGPVVVFNTAPARCDALLLTTIGVTHLELPGLTWNTLVEKVIAFHQAQTQVQSTSGAGGSEDPQQVLTGVLGWLWDVAAGPVLGALGFDTEPAGDDWPRLWWSPGGLLGQLPLHAAGYHDDSPGARHTVMDRVVSSYTPTVRALRYAREQAARHEHGADVKEEALVVAMPTTPDQGALPFVEAEVEKVRGHVPGTVILSEVETAFGGTGADLTVPTRARVLEYLPGAPIAHFACHGYTDPGDPSQSRLLLHDHAEDPLTVAALGAVRLDRAQLAYLSACSTASITNGELVDEAIHVASAFQLAGFPHVVGTLWEVNDQVSATVADLFYAHLCGEDGQALDPTRAAHALHAAVRAVRDGTDLQDILPGWDRIAAPLLWAPYLHTGA